MKKPLNFGPGLAPAVTIVDGLVYVAFGVQPDALVVVVLTTAGTIVRREIHPDGFFNAWPRFSGPWIVYKRNHDWRPTAMHVQTGQRWTYPGQADGNFGVVVNAAFNLVAYQWTNTYDIYLGSLLDGDDAPTSMHGAPDGLDALVDPSHVTLRKDTRESVPGMLYPARAGDLIVGERPDAGIAVQLEGDERRVALAGQDTPTPSCAAAWLLPSGDAFYAIVTGGREGVRLLLGSRADLLALPPASSVQRPVDVPRIGKPCFLGWFEFGHDAIVAPGNCSLHVTGSGDVGPMMVMSAERGTVAEYVSGSPDGDVDAVERAIVAARGEQAVDGLTIPILAYWTATAQQVRVPAGADLVGVEAYRHVGESLAVFEARVRAAVGRGGRPWLIAQCYTSNANNDPDLRALVPVYARIARDCPTVEGILVFSAGARDTGWDSHPEVHDAWHRLAAGITGTPALPAPPDPVPPAPGPPPVDPAPPDHPGPPPAPFRSHTKGLTMEIDGKIVQLRGAGGRLVSPDAPNTGTWGSLNRGWRGNRWIDGGDAAHLRATKLPNGRYTFTSLAHNGLAGADGGQYSPALDKQAYFKPDGDPDAGELEQWRVYDGNENGAIEAQIEQVTDDQHPAGAGKQFFVCPLAVELVL